MQRELLADLGGYQQWQEGDQRLVSALCVGYTRLVGRIDTHYKRRSSGTIEVKGLANTGFG